MLCFVFWCGFLDKRLSVCLTVCATSRLVSLLLCVSFFFSVSFFSLFASISICFYLLYFRSLIFLDFLFSDSLLVDWSF